MSYVVIDRFNSGKARPNPVSKVNTKGPPFSATEGLRVIVGLGAGTGVWSGQEGSIAEFRDGSWEFTAVALGDQVFVISEEVNFTFDGTEWVGKAQPTSVKATNVDNAPMVEDDMVIVGGAPTGGLAAFSPGDLLVVSEGELSVEPATTVNEPDPGPADGDKHRVGPSPAGVFAAFATGSVAVYSLAEDGWEEVVVNTENDPRLILEEGDSVLVSGSGEFPGQEGYMLTIVDGSPKLSSAEVGTSLWDEESETLITNRGASDWRDPVEEGAPITCAEDVVARTPMAVGDNVIAGPSLTGEYVSIGASPGELITAVESVGVLTFTSEAITTENAPPGGSADGDKHLVGTGTGEFAGKDGKLATYEVLLHPPYSRWTFKDIQTENDPRKILRTGESVILDGDGAGEFVGKGGQVGTMRRNGTLVEKQVPIGTSILNKQSGVSMTRRGDDDWRDPTASDSQTKSQVETAAAIGSTLSVEVSDGEEITLDMAAGAGELTLSVGGMVPGKTYGLTVDNTGSSMTIAYGPEFKFEGGSAPALSSNIDKFTLTTDGADIYVSTLGLNFS